MELKHILKYLMNDPNKFEREEFRYLRDFIAHVQMHRVMYPEVMGVGIMTQPRKLLG